VLHQAAEPGLGVTVLSRRPGERGESCQLLQNPEGVIQVEFFAPLLLRGLHGSLLPTVARERPRSALQPRAARGRNWTLTRSGRRTPTAPPLVAAADRLPGVAGCRSDPCSRTRARRRGWVWGGTRGSELLHLNQGRAAGHRLPEQFHGQILAHREESCNQCHA